jgi:hypothetical protein
VQHDLEPQLVSLVGDDEEELVVLLAEAGLQLEELQKPEVGTV